MTHTTRGGLTFAFGYNYERMAYALALTLRKYAIPLTVVVSDKNSDPYLPLRGVANVVTLQGYHGKFGFEAFAYKLSPYDLTLKLDADMIVPAETQLDKYLDIVAEYPVTSGIAYDLSSCRNLHSPYRLVETSLDLPLIYSAAFTFKKGDVASSFFSVVNHLFASWHSLPLLRDKLPPTTDTIYSIAWKHLGLPDPAVGIPFVHMKKGVAHNKISNSWIDDTPFSISDRLNLRVTGHQVRLLFHYYDKRFLSDSVLQRIESCTS